MATVRTGRAHRLHARRSDSDGPAFVIAHDEHARLRVLRGNYWALTTREPRDSCHPKARGQKSAPTFLAGLSRSQAVPALQTPELPTQHLGLGDPVYAVLRLGACAKATMVAASAVRVGAALARRALARAGTAPMVRQVVAWHLVVPQNERAPACIAQKFPSRDATRVTQWVVLQGLRPDSPFFDLFRPVLTGPREASISRVRPS
jgi:hypothetical protein